MLYKLIKTDLWYNGNLIPEGTSIELSKDEAASLSQYLEEISSTKEDLTSTKRKTNKPKKLVKEIINENRTTNSNN